MCFIYLIAATFYNNENFTRVLSASHENFTTSLEYQERILPETQVSHLEYEERILPETHDCKYERISPVTQECKYNKIDDKTDVNIENHFERHPVNYYDTYDQSGKLRDDVYNEYFRDEHVFVYEDARHYRRKGDVKNRHKRSADIKYTAYTEAERRNPTKKERMALRKKKETKPNSQMEARRALIDKYKRIANKRIKMIKKNKYKGVESWKDLKPATRRALVSKTKAERKYAAYAYEIKYNVILEHNVHALLMKHKLMLMVQDALQQKPNLDLTEEDIKAIGVKAGYDSNKIDEASRLSNVVREEKDDSDSGADLQDFWENDGDAKAEEEPIEDDYDNVRAVSRYMKEKSKKRKKEKRLKQRQVERSKIKDRGISHKNMSRSEIDQRLKNSNYVDNRKKPHPLKQKQRRKRREKAQKRELSAVALQEKQRRKTAAMKKDKIRKLRKLRRKLKRYKKKTMAGQDERRRAFKVKQPVQEEIYESKSESLHESLDCIVDTIKNTLSSIYVMASTTVAKRTRTMTALAATSSFLYQIYRARSFGDYATAMTQFALIMKPLCNSVMVDFQLQMDELERILQGCFREFDEHRAAAEEKIDIDFDKFDRYRKAAEQRDDDWVKFETVVPESDFAFEDELAAERPDSVESWIDTFQRMIQITIKSDVLSVIKNFLMALISTHLFPKNLAYTVSKTLGIRKAKLNILEFVSIILQGVQTMFVYGKALMNGVSLNEIVMAEDPVTVALRKMQRLERASRMLSDGLPKEGYMDVKEFFIHAKEVMETSKVLLKNLSPFHPKYAIFKNMVEVFTDLYFKTKGESNNKSRVPPVAIILHGYPGTGKSKLLTYLARVWSKVKGREFSENQMFSRCTTSQYWDQYDPDTKPFIHMSELGSMSKKQAEMHGDAILSEVLSLVDGLPFACDMSAVEDKGKVFARPEMILIDTNNPDLHVKELMYSEGAVKRRFIVIDASVLPEFRVEGSTALDSRKSMAAGPNYLDRYNFTVTTYTSNGNSAVPCKAFTGRINGLTNWLADTFIDHISLQEQVDSTDIYSFLYEGPVEVDDFDFWSESSDTYDDSTEYVLSESESSEYKGEYELTIEDEDYFNYAQEIVMNPSEHCDDIIVTAEKYIEVMSDIEEDEIHVSQSESFLQVPNIFDWNNLFLCVMFIFYQLVTMTYCSTVEFFALMLDTLGWILKTRLERIGIGITVSLAYLVFQMSYAPIMLTIVLLIVFYDDLLLNIYNYGYNEARDVIACKKNDAISNVREAIVGKFHNPFKRAEFCAIAVAGIMAAFGLIQIWRKHIRSVPESHDIVHPIYSKEQKLQPGITLIRNKLEDNKFNLMEIEPASLTNFHGSPEMLTKSLSSNIVKVRVITREHACFTYALGVTSTYALMNLHATCFEESFTVKISPTGNWETPQFTIDVTPMDVIHVTDDVILVNFKKRPFKSIMCHFVNKIPARFEGIMLDFNVHVRTVKNVHVKDPNREFIVKEGLQYMLKEHDVGMCGLPIVGKVNHDGSAIVGIHGSGDANSAKAYAIRLTDRAIITAVEQMDKNSVYVPTLSMRAISESLTVPNPKSLVHYVNLEHVRYLGKLNEPVLMNKESKLTRTPFHDEIPGLLYDVLGFESKVEVGPPPMKAFRRNGEYFSPSHVAIKKMDNDPPTLNPYVMKHVIGVLTERIVKGLYKQNITRLSPLSMDDAINGVELDAYISRINASTGSGYGFPGKKSVYLPLNEEKEERVTREPSPFLCDKLEYLINNYENGDMSCPIVQAQLKDEARLKEKNDIGATRMFYMTSTDMLVLSRMLLAPFYSMMVDCGDLFCTSVGINMHQDADKFVRTLHSFSPYIMEGDYSGYDVANPLEIARAANTVIYNVLKAMGYNDYSLSILQGLLSDLLFPILSIDTDLFMKAGMQPSGKYGTAEDNSLRGLIMLMYAWYEDDVLQSKNFFEYVLPRIYGDDLLAAVKPDVIAEFNNTTYCIKCKDLYGMKFTSAAKDGNLEDYLTVETMSFLKRKFVVDKETGKWVAQLSLESVSKALCWYLPSQEVTLEYQSLSCMGSMLWEIFFHANRQQYDVVRNTFIVILVDTFKGTHAEYDFELPTYEIIFERINPPLMRSESERETRQDRGEEEYRECYLATCGHLTLQKDDNSQLSSVEANTVIVLQSRNTTESERLSNMAQSLKIERQELLDDLKEPANILANLSIEEIRDNNAIWTYPIPPSDIRERVTELSQIEDRSATIARIERLTSFRIDAYTEAEMDGNGQMDLKQDIENMVDVMGNEENLLDDTSEFMWEQGQSNELDLDDFFGRPVRIIERSIAPGGSFSSVYPVWDLYTLNPAVRAKLRNYAYLRGDLHLQIEISGTPFHYGHIFVSYQPYPLRNANLVQHPLLFNNKIGLVNYLSQSEQFASMNVNSNTPLHMVCPFISTKPMNRLYNSTFLALADTTSYADFEEFGSLYIGSYYTIEAAAASASDIGLRVYAWLENVHLGTTTATQIVISTESEMKTGPVERVATRLANLSKQFGSVESIKPLAVASEMVFRGVGQAAAWYGWSRPVKISEPMYVKNRPYTNGAHTIGSDTCKKITLDPMQELTVDPRVCGYDSDDMTISNICNRLSYVDLFIWSPTDTLMADSIWKCKVHPQISTVIEDVTYQFIQPSAMAFAATPFLYWRGDITFHFEIMCSRYHRGKLAFYYEPNVEQYALIDADIATHKNYIKIVDIQEEQSFDLCIEWASPRAWLKTLDISKVRGLLQDFNDIVESYGYSNGYIGVTPFNELASPDGSSIRILVSVRSDNMVFNQVSSAHLVSERILTESMFDEKYSCISLNESTATMNNINEYHFGEIPLSFRSLIKRFVFESALTVTASGGSDYSMRYIAPMYYGPQPTYSASTTRPNLIGYLAYAYMGYRGSMKKRIRAITADTMGHPLQGVVVSIADPQASKTHSLSWNSDPAFTTLNGSVTFVPDTNGGIEFELPFYSNNLFGFSFADDGIGTNATGDMEETWSKTFIVDIEAHDNTKSENWVIEDSAAGDDFTLLRFNGSPFYRLTA